MNWQDVYKFPLHMWENFEIKVFTADNKMAFDWLGNFTSECKKKTIAIINGEQKPSHKDKFYRDGIQIYHKDLGRPILRIRGWGYLTGVGGLHLSEDKAINIQNEFGDYIVKQLNDNSAGNS
jgi:hypothetical protein